MIPSLQNLCQREADKVAILDMGVGQGELWRREMEVIVHQKVDVDDAVVIDRNNGAVGKGATATLMATPHETLYLLRDMEESDGRELRVDADDGIDKAVVGVEAPWLRKEQRGLAHNSASPRVYMLHRHSYVLLLVAKVCAETKIYGMCHSRGGKG